MTLKKGRRYKKEEPFICLGCNQVWQFTEHNLTVDYIIGFPKYGCTERLCRLCKKEERKNEKMEKSKKRDKLLPRGNTKVVAP